MNYYEILKVSKNATEKEIRNSYKNLIKQYHPDIYKGSKAFAEKTSSELNNAYSVLSNHKKRAEYDLTLITPKNTEPVIKSYNDYTNNINNKIEENTETWNQKFKNYLYDFVDKHTKNLSSKTKALLILIIILIAIIITLLSLYDYLKLINVFLISEIKIK